MKINLKENERIDDLQLNNLKIIQNKNGFCFGIDSVLLSDFAKEIKENSRVLDLGTGTGILPILLCGKTDLKEIIGMEIQEDVAEMAQRNSKLNGLENRFKVINENILNIEKVLEKRSFDAIVTNPPYKRKDTGRINEEKTKQIARHEITANLEDFIKTSETMLKDKGSLYMVHRPERLVELMSLLKKYKLEPKILKLVQPTIDKNPNLVLIKAVKNAKPFLKIEKTLIVYNQDRSYTDEILKIYGKEQNKC